MFFRNPNTPVCSATSAAGGFYCPVASLDLTAVVQGAGNGINASLNFSVANADALISSNPTFAAFSNLAGPFFGGVGGTFDWGLPFFYGRRVFTAFDQQSTPAGVGPYVAF